MSRGRQILIVIILGSLIGVALVLVQYEVSISVNSSLSYRAPTIVAENNATWAAGLSRVWANFSSPSFSSGYLNVTWDSSTSVTYNVVLEESPYEEIVLGSYHCGSTTFCGRGYVVFPLSGYLLATPSPAYSWFQVDNCTMSNCPSGWVDYTIALVLAS
jgi:hypothetical protein